MVPRVATISLDVRVQRVATVSFDRGTVSLDVGATLILLRYWRYHGRQNSIPLNHSRNYSARLGT